MKPADAEETFFPQNEPLWQMVYREGQPDLTEGSDQRARNPGIYEGGNSDPDRGWESNKTLQHSPKVFLPLEIIINIVEIIHQDDCCSRSSTEDTRNLLKAFGFAGWIQVAALPTKLDFGTRCSHQGWHPSQLSKDSRS